MAALLARVCEFSQFYGSDYGCDIYSAVPRSVHIMIDTNKALHNSVLLCEHNLCTILTISFCYIQIICIEPYNISTLICIQ